MQARGPNKVGGPKGGGPTGGGPKGGGPEGWGAEGWGARNFALFFHLPPKNSSFSSLSGGLVEFQWCLKRRGAQMCTFGVLWLSCANPSGPAKFWAVPGGGGGSGAPNMTCQRIGYIFDCESPRKHASSVIARKALR